MKHLPRYLSGFSQIKNSVDDVRHTGNLPHRLQFPQNILRMILVHRSVYNARSNGVHAYTMLDVFHREAPCDRLQSAFRDHRNGGIGSSNRMIDQRRSDIDNASAGLLRQHLLDSELTYVEKALDVDRNERTQILNRVIDKRFRDVYPGIVDENIDSSELMRRYVDYFRRRRGFGNASINQR